jgi:hypothetical protein
MSHGKGMESGRLSGQSGLLGQSSGKCVAAFDPKPTCVVDLDRRLLTCSGHVPSHCSAMQHLHPPSVMTIET